MRERLILAGRLSVWLWPADVDLAELCKRPPWERRGGLLLCRAHNLVTTNGKSVAAALFGSASGYVGAQYLALGTSSTAPAVTDTALGAEVFRKPFAGVFTSSAAVDCSTYLLNGDAVFTWAEAGLFGNGAGAGSGSGTLLTHALWSPTIAKTNVQQYTVDYNITES